MIRRLFASWFEQERQRGYQLGYHQAQTDERARRDQVRTQNLQYHVGTPVIVIPNEWDNPVIGFGARVEMIGTSSVLVVKNFLTGEEVWCGGVMMSYSRQKLDAALSLNPYDLCALTFTNAVGFETFDKPKSAQRWPSEQIIATLEQNGFFEAVDRFLLSANQDQS